MKYDPKKIEGKWQKYWLSKKTFVANSNSKSKKKYVLVEFPYPSGAGLHMGHMRPFVAGDVVSKYFKLKGFNTVYPMGWDAFGLPAENYAIKNKVHPSVSTKKNVANAKKQLLSWGTGFDWSREVNTTDPAYYKWTQKLFLEFFKAGLAYEKFGEINWCPKDKTGLANEEVVDGKCERCGTTVEKKNLRQWYLKITEYADKLLEGLKHLPEWPEAVKLQQENWIGKSEGAEIEFKLKDSEEKIRVFTTRADTLFGVTYVVLAPEHPMLENLESRIENLDEINKYIENCKNKTEEERTNDKKEKTGVEIKGIKAINPANGEEVPVWIADYVLGNYGTGAVMAVPAHDERDFEFAKKFNLPVKQVIGPDFLLSGQDAPRGGVEILERRVVDAVIENGKGDFLLVKESNNNIIHYHFVGGGTDGETDLDAIKREVVEETGYDNFEVVRKICDDMHCYGFRHTKNKNQKTVGPAFYVKLINENRIKSEVEDGKHEIVWVAKEKVKDMISWGGHSYIWNKFINPDSIDIEDGKLINSNQFNCLTSIEARIKITEFVGGKIVTKYKLRDWVFSRQRYWGEPIPLIHCEKCGIVAVPDKDLPVKLPNVKNYEPTGTGESPLAKIDKWVNTKCPKCKGKAKRETNTMPQWAGSSWYWLRYMDSKNKKEFSSLKTQKYWSPVDLYFGGMEHTTLHLLYSRFWNLFLYDRKLVSVKEPYKKRVPHGIILGPDGEKMSKSRGNVVNPDDLIKIYGADTVRLYMMFLGPHGAQVSWNDKGIVGARRFIERVFNLPNQIVKKEDKEVTKTLHKTIKKITEDLETFSFNTAVSAMMIFVNKVNDHKGLTKSSLNKFVTLLAPFVPHTAEEVWNNIGNKKSIFLEKWPKFDSKEVVDLEIDIVIQINGKLRGKIKVEAGLPEESVLLLAKSDQKIAEYLSGQEVKKAIYIKDKLVNFVI